MSQVRCIEAARGSLSAIRPLFTTTVFTSAFLLFSIQPMFAKMVLPLFGSSPAVWNTCMVFFAALPAPLAAKVGVIGLGTRSLACYGVPAQQFTFCEIDPAVIRIARDTGYFTFLRICPPEVRIVLGDARLSLAAAADAYYGLLVLDAFSSDAIPGHLLTREALVLYEPKLAAPGLLAIHISNNHLDLEPALANPAHDAGLLAVARFDERVGPDEARAGKTPSRWVVLARRPEGLRGLADDPRWHPLAPRPDKTLWTDDFSNLLEVIRWR